MSIRVVYKDAKPYRCAIARQTRNSIGFLPWKWGIPIAVFSCRKLGEYSIWGETLPYFCHKNKAKRCRIFTVEIWQQFQTHLESIDQDHTHSETKSQSPIHLKPWKLMPIAHFQLPMSLNYDFIKTNDCLRTGIVGCLTHSPHVTRFPNSRIKIFYSSILD